jgi:FixJ family two-component response regulator
MTIVNLVFVVDGDSSARKGIARLVRTANYEVRDFDSVKKFLNTLGFEVPHCVVLDAGTPGLSSEELQAELKACGAHPPIIIVTALDDLQSRQKAEKLNAVAFFRKPVDGTALLDAIAWALRSGGTSSTHEKR